MWNDGVFEGARTCGVGRRNGVRGSRLGREGGVEHKEKRRVTESKMRGVRRRDGNEGGWWLDANLQLLGESGLGCSARAMRGHLTRQCDGM